MQYIDNRLGEYDNLKLLEPFELLQPLELLNILNLVFAGIKKVYSICILYTLY